MRYMLLIYTREDEFAKGSQEEMQRVTNEHWAVMRESRERGALEQAEPLAKTSTATTVRWQNGTTVITDGPFAETKEQLAGYYILNCENLDEAIGWAKKIPTGCGGLQGCVEVRALREIPVSSQAEETLSSNSDHG